MKKIAAITMARDDHFFIQRWLKYYGDALGAEHLYLYLDGEDQVLPENLGNANGFIRKKTFGLSRAKGEDGRLSFLSDVAEDLFKNKGYDLVIGVDCDEFLVVDPALNTDLKTYLSNLPIETSVSGLGLDIGHQTDKEGTLDHNKSVLEQRRHAVLSSRYTKPSVIAKPVRWGAGFHRVRGHNFNIDKNLYLMHIGYCDLDLVGKKLNADRIQSGWGEHIKRQAKTIALVTDLPEKGDGDVVMQKARTLQTYLRPIYAWNKPLNVTKKWVVKIPERFSKIFV